MRPIKFRVWDKKEQYMSYDDGHFYITPYGEVMSVNEGVPLENQILMQYTGLKDKNGTEIYEGDVVKENGKQVNHDTDFGESCSFQKVWYDRKSACYRFGKLMAYEYIPLNLFNNYDVEVEVVGNVFENQDLLSDES